MSINNEMPGQSAAAHSAAQTGDQPCREIDGIPTRAREAKAIAESVSPAVSPAISPATANGREQLKTETSSDKSGNQSGSQSGTSNEKPNCYECKYRRELVGDTHSSCGHPAATPFALILFAAGSSEFKINQIHVRGNTHGVRSGWFLWPANFDPTWLEICSGFVRQSEGERHE